LLRFGAIGECKANLFLKFYLTIIENHSAVCCSSKGYYLNNNHSNISPQNLVLLLMALKRFLFAFRLFKIWFASSSRV
jgi:hypothetical protein